VLSPDGKAAALVLDWNLRVRDTVTLAEKQLTRDGVLAERGFLVVEIDGMARRAETSHSWTGTAAAK